MYTSSSVPTPATPTCGPCGGKIGRSNVPVARATTSVPGVPTITGQGSNAIGAQAVDAPSTTSPTRCWPRASGRCRTGFSPLFCCVCHAHLAAWPESWASISVPATAGAGGCAMPLCPMKWIASWRARSKRMNSITLLARRGKRNKVGQNRWDADRVVAAKSASLAVVIMRKTDRRSSRG